MKEYFYLKDNVQYGPFTIEQLQRNELNSETFVWTEGMDNWQKVKDVSELSQIIKPKVTPPPPPLQDIGEKLIKTELSGKLNVVTERATNPTIEAITPTNSNLTFILIWCGLHFFALLTSYSEIEIFNDSGKPKTEEFWPFVEFKYCVPHIEWNSNGEAGVSRGEDCEFLGFFADYDWSEFAVYVGGALLIFVLLKLPNENDNNLTEPPTSHKKTNENDSGTTT